MIERLVLERAARRVGAQPRFVDWSGQRRRVSTATLRAVVDALGDRGPVTRPIVAAGATRLQLEHPADRAVLQLDDGSTEVPLTVHRRSLTIPADVPVGVHHLELGSGPRTARRIVLRRPPPHPVPPWLVGSWGVFTAVHALRGGAGDGDRGVGTLAELDRLSRLLEPWRPRLISVLPLFAIEPGDPSPYSPVSQHFWNEAHLDLDRLALDLGVSRPDRPADRSGADRRSVDWVGVTGDVHRHLDRMSDELGEHGDPARLLSAGGLDPGELQAYCVFRAGGDERARRRHRLAQLAMEHQLVELSRALGQRGQGLTLDLPIGTSDCGFDVAHHPELFVAGWSIGAPPDEFFRLGQRWGLPPIDPGRSATTGHDFIGRSIRAVSRHAGAIRIDHVMGLERLWWVPPGASADSGVYVDQPTRELAARLAIETHRAGVAVIGENLGTVPPTTAELLSTEGMLGMYEELFAVGGLAGGGNLPEVPVAVAAGTGTHDMPTFAGFAAGTDIELMERFQGVAPDQAAVLAAARRDDLAAWADQLRVAPLAPALLAATLDRLTRSEAAHVVVNLEDLWLETRPLNVPGTGPEVPNWRRRTRLDLDQVAGSPSVRRLLSSIGAARPTAGGGPSAPCPVAGTSPGAGTSPAETGRPDTGASPDADPASTSPAAQPRTASDKEPRT